MTFQLQRTRWQGRRRWVFSVQTWLFWVDFDTVWRGWRIRQDRCFREALQVRLGFINALVRWRPLNREERALIQRLRAEAGEGG